MQVKSLEMFASQKLAQRLSRTICFTNQSISWQLIIFERKVVIYAAGFHSKNLFGLFVIPFNNFYPELGLE